MSRQNFSEFSDEWNPLDQDMKESRQTLGNQGENRDSDAIGARGSHIRRDPTWAACERSHAPSPSTWSHGGTQHDTIPVGTASGMSQNAQGMVDLADRQSPFAHGRVAPSGLHVQTEKQNLHASWGVMGDTTAESPLRILPGGNLDEGITRDEAQTALEGVSKSIRQTAQQQHTLQRSIGTLESNVAGLVRSQSAGSQDLMQVREKVDQLYAGSGNVVTAAQTAQQAMIQTQRTARDVQATSSIAVQSAAEAKTVLSQIRDVPQQVGQIGGEAVLRIEQERSKTAEGTRRTHRAIKDQLQAIEDRVNTAATVATRELTAAMDRVEKTASTIQQSSGGMSKLLQQMSNMEIAFQQLSTRSEIQQKVNEELQAKLQAAEDRIQNAEIKTERTSDRSTEMERELDQWNQWYEREWLPHRNQQEQVPRTVERTVPMTTSRLPTPFTSVSPSNATPSLMNPEELQNGNGASDSTQASEISLRLPGDRQRPPSFTRTSPLASTSTNGTPFNFQLKPKEPPVYHGRLQEDVISWLAKVRDFFYLTNVTEQQKVAYTATLLVDTAGEWWISYMRQRNEQRPRSFEELATALRDRFGSRQVEETARLALADIKQQPKETVHSYGARFSALLNKLMTYDEAWAKTQFIRGLTQDIARFVYLAEPTTLAQAIAKAEDVNLADYLVRQSGAHGQQQQNQSANFQRTRGFRRRGQFRGRGFVAAMTQAQHQPTATNSLAADQCAVCQGFGHWARDCPSRGRGRQQRGRNTRGRARRGARGWTARGWNPRGWTGRGGRTYNAALADAEPIPEEVVEDATAQAATPGPSDSHAVRQGN